MILQIEIIKNMKREIITVGGCTWLITEELI